MLDKIFSLFAKNLNGLLPDDRSKEEKSKDYQHAEVSAGASLVSWWAKSPAQWKRFAQRFQLTSYSCCAQAMAKVLGIENQKEEGKFMVFSALDIYDRRINKPTAGMVAYDALNIPCKQGLCLEEQLPSQRMTEEQMNAAVSRTLEMAATEAKYRGGGYVELPVDIDAVASILEQGKGVFLLFNLGNGEWNHDVPEVKTWFIATRHAVAAVDYALWNGEKALIIEDSTGSFPSYPGQRVITQSYFKSRCYYAGYLLELSNDPYKRETIKHTFTQDLKFGMMSSPEVVALQGVLQTEGFFPTSIPRTGNYLQITANAVRDFRKCYSLQGDGQAVDKSMREILNAKYGVV